MFNYYLKGCGEGGNLVRDEGPGGRGSALPRVRAQAQGRSHVRSHGRSLLHRQLVHLGMVAHARLCKGRFGVVVNKIKFP